MKVLITGAGGMLGSYVAEHFQNEEVSTLGLRDFSDFKVDLTKEEPDFGNKEFQVVIHAAGTEDDVKARELNLEGTKRLLSGLEKFPPEYFVFISSYRVYSRDAGENINEEANTWATDDTGKSKALAEEYLKKWCAEKDITLSIVRPARMFGNGVHGDTLQLFNDAISGKYIHIRGNDAKVSLVCAYDVAKAIKAVYVRGGIYNASDNHPVRFIDMVEALTANAGAKKRMTHLPADWAEWIWRLGRWIPSINRNLAPEMVESRMKSLTIDGSKFIEAAGFNFHDTVAVIERKDPDYPYIDKYQKNRAKLHEV